MPVRGRQFAVLLALLLAACGGSPPAPIEDHSLPGRAGAPPGYTVTRGDTLYSIAFRYGLDYRRLAAANRIAEPYTIYVGQTLQLAERDPPPPSRRAAPSGEKAGGRSADSAQTTASPPPAPAAQAPASKPASRDSGASSRSDDNRVVSAWRWPSSGRVVRRFDGERHKGLDIAGSRGDPIRATAAGRVVYAGTGIVGYGLMLIVRHNDEYLSAYGHNDVVLVEEGDEVDAGQQLARMGSSGTDTVKLHFELRRRGRPVDPLKLLPRR